MWLILEVRCQEFQVALETRGEDTLELDAPLNLVPLE